MTTKIRGMHVSEISNNLNFELKYIEYIKINDLSLILNFDSGFSPHDIEQMFINTYKDLKSTIYFHDNTDWKFIYTEFKKINKIG